MYTNSGSLSKASKYFCPESEDNQYIFVFWLLVSHQYVLTICANTLCVCVCVCIKGRKKKQKYKNPKHLDVLTN